MLDARLLVDPLMGQNLFHQCLPCLGCTASLKVQQGHAELTPVAGFEYLLGDAVVEGEFVVPEGGHDARSWSHNLLALVVADGERVGDG